jgi:hypothetical protein
MRLFSLCSSVRSVRTAGSEIRPYLPEAQIPKLKIVLVLVEQEHEYDLLNLGI